MGTIKYAPTPVEETMLRAIKFLGGAADAVGTQATYEQMGGRRGAQGVYRTLDGLVHLGFLSLTKVKSPPERGGHRKRFYHLTDAAEAFLREAA